MSSEKEYMIKQLENELEFYEKSLQLLETIHLSQINKRAADIVGQIIRNRDIVKAKLGK